MSGSSVKITASTPLYALLGNPVSQSLSPILQNGWINEHDFDAVYVALNIAPSEFETALAGLESCGLMGANVTTPFKQQAAKSASVLSERAHATNSVNCLTRSPSGFVGDSTDGVGFVADLDARAAGWRDTPGSIVLIGAGGAARALLHALVNAGDTTITVVNRNQDRAREAVGMFPKKRVTAVGWDGLGKSLSGAGLVINATSAGFRGQNPLIVDFSGTSAQCLVYDTIYAPRETAFLAEAKRQRRKTLNGLGMLVGQGAVAFENWFGVRPDFLSGLARLEAEVAL